MMLKSSDSFFKRSAATGTVILAVTMLAACGGGPIDNTHLSANPPKDSSEKAGGNELAVKPESEKKEGEDSGQALMTYEQWKEEEAKRNAEPLANGFIARDRVKYLSYEEWQSEEGFRQEQRKKSEAAVAALDAGKSEEEKKAAEEIVRQTVAHQATELAKNYEDEKFDDTDSHPVDPVFVVVGLDKDSLWDEQLNKAGRKAKFVSLNGKDLYRYYRENCPVTEGLDPERVQQGITRRTYECMAGIYVGRNSKGNMCYTFFDTDGKVSHINDNTVVYPFKPGNSVSPYAGYTFADPPKDGSPTPTAELVHESGALRIPERSVDGALFHAFTVPPSVPLFSRFDVGGEMLMILNTFRRYANPTRVKQDLDVPQTYRTQQAVFKFNSQAETIDIYQLNTDTGFGTGSLDDTCYVSFKTGLKGN
ncbi:MAG: hypothetical protein Q4D91_09010 [Lautropia sp.]|nr:hypothetical protein [Lautropia sp.]